MTIHQLINIAILIHFKYNVVPLRMIYVKSWFLENRRPSPAFLKPLILIFVKVGKNAINSLLFVLISPNSANKTFVLQICCQYLVMTKKTKLIGKLVTFNSRFLKPKNAYLRWHDEQWNKKIPNSHVYNQKIESAFHSPSSSHDVYNACVTKETKYKDHNVGQSHPQGNPLLKWGVGGAGLGCIY